MKRKSTIIRKTKETNVLVSLNIDGNGKRKIDTSVGFLNHMLDLFAKHGLFDLSIKATGDIYIDEHHKVEGIFKATAHAIRMACEIDTRARKEILSTKGSL